MKKEDKIIAIQNIAKTIEEYSCFYLVGELRPPEGEFSAREISPGLFYEIWNQAQERPDGFMGMFF